MTRWSRINGIPSLPKDKLLTLLEDIWSQHRAQLTMHITKSSIDALRSLFPEAIFHCEDKHASSSRIFCPCLYFGAIEKTSMDPTVFTPRDIGPESMISQLVDTLTTQYHRSYPLGHRKRTSSSVWLHSVERQKGIPEWTTHCFGLWMHLFAPCSTFWPRLLYQLVPVGCPQHFAVGDVYELLAALQQIPEHQPLSIFNQDLAGFFTSIEPSRFIGSWYMLLDFLRPKMNVNDDQTFSVYPGTTNQPGDIIKGRTFRRLNVTRKITIGDVPALLKTALEMQTFALRLSMHPPATWQPHGQSIISGPLASWWSRSANSSGPSTTRRF